MEVYNNSVLKDFIDEQQKDLLYILKKRNENITHQLLDTLKKIERNEI